MKRALNLLLGLAVFGPLFLSSASSSNPRTCLVGEYVSGNSHAKELKG